MSNHFHSKLLFLVLLLVFSQGCLEEFGANPDRNYTVYSLEIDPGRAFSYPGGGGLFLLDMTPGPEFQDSLVLSLQADSGLQAVLHGHILTEDRQVTEITLRPDSALETGGYTLQLTAIHGTQTNVFLMTTTVVDYTPGNTLAIARSKRDTFLTWINKNYPDYGVAPGDEWSMYNKQPQLTSPKTWAALNTDWEINIRWLSVSSTAYWFLLRPRNERDPVFAAKQFSDGEIHLIPVSMFGR